MTYTWLSLVPPLIVIICAFISGRINLSLFIGIITAALVTQPSIASAASLVFNQLLKTISNPENLFLYGFLFLISTLVVLMTQIGYAATWTDIVTQKIKSKRGIQLSSFLLSSLLFIDDYLSILTTGYIMRSLTDRFSIPRVKLAFLIHSLAGPLVILAPVSGWVATITAYIAKAGVDNNLTNSSVRIIADPFYIYLKTIPFIFYSFLIIASVLYIIQQALSFGPMKKHEATGSTEDIVCAPISATAQKNYSYLQFLLPIASLVLTVMIGIPYAGGYYLFGGTHSFIESIKNNQYPFLILFLGGLVGLLTALLINIKDRKLSLAQLPTIAREGFDLMHTAIIMVFLASTLSGMLAQYVGTGQYLASLLLHSISLPLLPVMFFFISLLCTLSTGTAWGTFALMIPIAIPMVTTLLQVTLPTTPDAIPLLYPVLGAILSGATIGDHLSPLSETTTMAATCTQVTPMDHVRTQLPYALPAVICTVIALLTSGLLLHYPLWLNALISLSISLVCCVILLHGLHVVSQKRR